MGSNPTSTARSALFDACGIFPGPRGGYLLGGDPQTPDAGYARKPGGGGCLNLGGDPQTPDAGYAANPGRRLPDFSGAIV